MTTIKLFAYFVIVLTSFFSCDISNIQTQLLEIQFPEIPKEKLWQGLRTRIVYYISQKGKQSFVVRDITSKRMQLRVYKGGIFPILACFQIDTRFSFQTFGSAGCPFASGAVYPYDKAKIGSIRLEYGQRAKVVRLMLLFHQRGGNIKLLNMHKLYSTFVGSSVSFIDEDIFFQSLAQRRLNRYSIKEQKFFDVQIPTEAQAWLHSWISVTTTQFLFTRKIVSLPKGIWMFLDPTSDNYALISLSSHGRIAMFSLH